LTEVILSFLQCKSEAKECASGNKPDCLKNGYKCTKACFSDDDDKQESMDEVLFDGAGQTVRIEGFVYLFFIVVYIIYKYINTSYILLMRQAIGLELFYKHTL